MSKCRTVVLIKIEMDVSATSSKGHDWQKHGCDNVGKTRFSILFRHDVYNNKKGAYYCTKIRLRATLRPHRWITITKNNNNHLPEIWSSDNCVYNKNNNHNIYKGTKRQFTQITRRSSRTVTIYSPFLKNVNNAIIIYITSASNFSQKHR